MKQALQLRLGQHLTMTPQLQQAIRLLQLSTLELQTEIQEALDSNLMLEIDEDSSDDARNESTPAAEAEPPTSDDSSEILNETSAAGENEIPEDLPVDSSWDDIYDNIATPVSSAPTNANANREFEFSGNTEESLHEHLRWQMQLTPFSDTDHAIAEFIIDAINDDGYLSMSLDDIHQALANELEIEADEIEAVLHRIQNFDPPGVGARDLKENLLLQIKQFPLESPWLKPAQELIEKHFDLLANREYAQLTRRLKISEEELKQILQLIQSLNPRPGSQITASQPEYIIPDVIVSKSNGKWKVELNPDAAPRLRVNPHYASLIKQVHNNEDNTYLKNHLQEARWFIKSLLSRNETLLKVATSIVKRQTDFLEHGEEAMKALVLHDIAEAVGMHESTISRVTSKKYMHTPRGIFELKYFFSSHVSTSNGGECSATAIRALIKKLIAAENTNKPLSDSKLAAILGDQGINVARRTVAKYREAMAIPPSNERKRLA
jgi:RNA polymerase sigma-54 factor